MMTRLSNLPQLLLAPTPFPFLPPAARGPQVSGRRGYLTFMNSSFQQLKEDCDGLPAFKMQQPIG